MKKAVLAFLLLLLLAVPALSADQACAPIWDNVAGHTYAMAVEDQNLDVVFSPSFSGPCPQGTVEVYDGIYVAPRLECHYMTQGDNLVVITCGDVEMPFMLVGNMLVYVDPNAPFMVEADK